MILCSVQNKAALLGEIWKQKRPYITQGFGENPEIYKQFGMDGHNGIDYRAAVGDKLFAPISGEVKVKDSGKTGYGLHIKIRNPYRLIEIVLGHLDSTGLRSGQHVNMGDFIGFSGNTGFSTGPHVHEGMRRLSESTNKDVFTWAVEDYNNGYYGYFDHLKYLITWKGGFVQNSF